MNVHQTPHAKPDRILIDGAYTAEGEARIEVRFDHGAFTHVESLSLIQAAELSRAIRLALQR